jgi:hypothetical protein
LSAFTQPIDEATDDAVPDQFVFQLGRVNRDLIGELLQV